MKGQVKITTKMSGPEQVRVTVEALSTVGHTSVHHDFADHSSAKMGKRGVIIKFQDWMLEQYGKIDEVTAPELEPEEIAEAKGIEQEIYDLL